MGAFLRNVSWVGVIAIAGISILSAPGCVLADDGGKDEQPANAAAASARKTGSTKADAAAKPAASTSAASAAKPEAPAPLTERERMLLDRVEQLERRVEELEMKSDAKTPVTAQGVSALGGSAGASVVDIEKSKSASVGNLAGMGRNNAAAVHDVAGAAANGSATTVSRVPLRRRRQLQRQLWRRQIRRRVLLRQRRRLELGRRVRSR